MRIRDPLSRRFSAYGQSGPIARAVAMARVFRAVSVDGWQGVAAPSCLVLHVSVRLCDDLAVHLRPFGSYALKGRALSRKVGNGKFLPML